MNGEEERIEKSDFAMNHDLVVAGKLSAYDLALLLQFEIEDGCSTVEVSRMVRHLEHVRDMAKALAGRVILHEGGRMKDVTPIASGTETVGAGVIASIEQGIDLLITDESNE